MKTHTTNYVDTFIEVAEDCPATKGEIPPLKEEGKSVARIQCDILSKNPYTYTSDDLLFQVYAERNHRGESDLQTARVLFFLKGRPCLCSSPLTKRYGWSIHSDGNGKVALYGVETSSYKKFTTDTAIKTVKAMRSKRA